MPGNLEAIRNGENFEHTTDLRLYLNGYFESLQYNVETTFLSKSGNVSRYDVYDDNGDLTFVLAQKAQFYTGVGIWLKNKVLPGKSGPDGRPTRREPDEALIDIDNKVIYLVEKKFQKSEGSVDEKLLGFGNKKKWYQRIVNGRSIENADDDTADDTWRVEFAFLGASDWWGMPKYKDTLTMMRQDGIKVMLDTYDPGWFEFLN